MKHTVVYDELEHKEGGIYCYLPFDNLDNSNKGVFKIGRATSYRSRTEQYHTYLPAGVWFVAFLEAPNRSYAYVEKKILEYVEKNGGVRITTPARLKPTEWVYASVSQIHKAFEEAEKEFKGTATLYKLGNLAKERNNMMKSKHFLGEVVVPV
jgi:hypothetical protein